MRIVTKSIFMATIVFWGFASLLAMDPPTDPSDYPEALRNVEDRLIDSDDRINPEQKSDLVAPVIKVLTQRDDLLARQPQLRNRSNARLDTNSAQFNNCGSIFVSVALQIPFHSLANMIIKKLELTGEKMPADAYFLQLFSFYVPITNELLARMPKVMGLGKIARNLSPEQKQVLANSIREQTNLSVQPYLNELVHGLLLDEVVTEGGNAIAYFQEPLTESFAGIPLIYLDRDEVANHSSNPLALHFDRAINAIRADLKKHYRWGENNKNGIWFDFKDARSIRPSVQFITAQAPSSSFLARVAQKLTPKLSRNSSVEPSSRRSSMGEVNPVLGRASESDLLHHRGSWNRKSIQIVEVRNGHLAPAPGAVPNNSPGRSPQHSPGRSPESVSPRDEEAKRVYKWSSRAPLRFFVVHPQIAIQVEVVNTASGKC